MKTTIIEILNKIANNEELPKNLYDAYTIANYKWDGTNYYSKGADKKLFSEYLLESLNKEIEILDNIENNKQDKISKFNTEYVGKRAENVDNLEHKIIWLIQDIRNMNDKINELIDKLNNL